MVCIIPKLVPREISWRKRLVGGALATGSLGSGVKAAEMVSSRLQACSSDTGVRAALSSLVARQMPGHFSNASNASTNPPGCPLRGYGPSVPFQDPQELAFFLTDLYLCCKAAAQQVADLTL